ncbi:MAG: NRDE family protein [Nannocystaceae bacterium]
MCTLLFAHAVRPDLPLIVAANRDEARGRPTAPLHRWDDLPVVAGRDHLGGGTWMGIGRGRWAALTNTREPGQERPRARSRGELVVAAITAPGGAEAALRAIAARADAYNRFNLVAGDASGLWWLSTFAGELRMEAVPPGIHGLSNHLLDTPWPKVQVGKDRLRAIAAAPEGPSVDALLELLGDRRGFADDVLPDTGVGLERERELAPLLIDTPAYGTRSSTALIVDAGGRATLAELTRDPLAGDRRVDLRLALDDLAADP